ncbi:3-deoxy-manno-octulosonate cytidylyltransferase [Leptobacterium sp. I13]|uniref:3-deoxy-manno-octulosonate cytidylyltransferase n=1 Tax=Leptobacterium meishanense TaxID=3128904 RepID=UPI0030EF60E7
MIPARYEASRFPGKLMQNLGGKPVILRTYEAAESTTLFDAVYVVTDSAVIFEEITRNGGKAIMSTKEHDCGSDRIAEAAEKLAVDIIVNVQGDEPFIDTESLARLLKVFNNDSNQEIDLASLMTPMTDWEEIKNPNIVKVIVDQRNFAMYFSRSPIPYPRDKETAVRYFKHKGIYAFRKQALIDFPKMTMHPLEATEKIEAIRYLEHGKKIKMVETPISGIGIDTPEDLKNAQKYFQNEL